MKSDKVKMFLFARWMATCYADEHCDDKMVSQHEPNFNPQESMSVLNREKGQWWKEQLEHFEKVVYPNYLKNGSAFDAYKFLEVKEKKKLSEAILDLNAGRNIRYKGVEYQIGNKRHNEVELYKDGLFVRTIKVTARTIFVKPKVVTGACERNGKFSL
jgi:hypothetical protein